MGLLARRRWRRVMTPIALLTIPALMIAYVFCDQHWFRTLLFDAPNSSQSGHERNAETRIELLLTSRASGSATQTSSASLTGPVSALPASQAIVASPSHTSSDSHRERKIRLGFVFVLDSKRNSGIVLPSIWEAFFQAAPSDMYAVMIANNPSNPPSFPHIEIGVPAARGGPGALRAGYGDIDYLSVVVQAAAVLANHKSIDGAIILSGSCVPIGGFARVYAALAPLLERGLSSMHTYRLESSTHASRRDAIPNPQLPPERWLSMTGQGYLLSTSHARVLYTVLGNSSNPLRRSLERVKSVEEHAIPYILQVLALPWVPDPVTDLTALRINDRSFTHFAGYEGQTFSELSEAAITRLREEGFLFARKVSAETRLPAGGVPWLLETQSFQDRPLGLSHGQVLGWQ